MHERAKLLNARLIVAVGDITAFSGDAIVNAANSSLLGGGGVDGAIHRSGGPGLLAECRRLRESSLPDGLPPGEAVMTGAGRLPLRAVIHTVGPVWSGGGRGEAGTLASCYRRSLELAEEARLETLAFPAISTGVYGYPWAAAARVAYRAVEAFLAEHEKPRSVHLVFYSEGDAEAFLEAIRADQAKGSPGRTP